MIEKMKFLSITGPKADIDRVVDTYLSRYEIHLENALSELKTVKEQIDSCPADRTDLKEEYQLRYDVINEYAPSLMSAEEVKAFIEEKFADVVASKNKGMIMKNVMPELKGKADGKVINEVVGELCK